MSSKVCSVSKLLVLLRICVSIYAIKMLAKETAVFVLIALPWVVFSIELERINLSNINNNNNFISIALLSYVQGALQSCKQHY